MKAKISRRIIALDYGCGTVAAYYSDCGAKDPTPKPLLDKDGEPSGFAVMEDRTCRVGKRLYAMGAKDFKDCVELHLNVKKMPDGDDSVQIEYAAALRRHIIDCNETLFSDGAEEVWLIGCPTGWRSRTIIGRYRRLFERAGFQNVIIVPESNAAMMFAQHAFEFVEKMDKKAGVLCIDLGAYSADATYIRPGEVVSHGGFVGASLIERMILALNLTGEFCENAGNSKKLRRVLKRLCETDPDFRTSLILQARRLKETYFTNSANGESFSDGENCTYKVSLRKSDPTLDAIPAQSFELVVNDEMVQAIIWERSVKSVLGREFNTLPEEVRGGLGDKTWGEALRIFVEETLAICPEFDKAAKGRGGKPYLILTGGASLMPFVQETIRRMRPNIFLCADREPMSTIARGLVYFGPDKLKAIEFDKRFEYIATHDAEGRKTQRNKSLVNQIFAHAHEILGMTLIDGAILHLTQFLNEAIDLWADRNWLACEGEKGYRSFFEGRNVKGYEIVPMARDDFKQWFQSGEIEADYAEAVAAAKKQISDEVDACFAPLLDEFRLGRPLVKASDIDLSYADKLLEWFRGKFDVLDASLAEKHERYSKLENPGWWDENVFRWVNATRAEIRAKWEQEWAADTAKLAKRLMVMLHKEFDSNDLYKPFVTGCMNSLEKALKSAKQMLLGELVVEDSFDESADGSPGEDVVTAGKAGKGKTAARARRASR